MARSTATTPRQCGTPKSAWQKLTNEVLADIEKETVDFQPNYDESLSEPKVLPTRVPNLLVNGSEGIAVGMATKIPPHNLTEIVDATIALIKRSGHHDRRTDQDRSRPGFSDRRIYLRPRRDLPSVSRRPRHYCRCAPAPLSTASAAATRERDAIVITEIPFQVNKARLIEKIAELVNEKKLDGISELRDESNREGMRIVIELKRDAVPQVVLNKLYKLTPMQSSFGIINICDRRRPAAASEPQADARMLRRISPRSGAPPNRVRPAKGPGARAYFGRLEQGDRRARLHHPADPQFAFGG